jgi:IS5 family transposase
LSKRVYLGTKKQQYVRQNKTRFITKYRKVLSQERNTKDKIYSLHEPQSTCIAKGKAYKAYEFRTKVAVVRVRDTGIIASIKLFFLKISF